MGTTATESRPRTWPTIAEADRVVSQLDTAHEAFDEFTTRCHWLVNSHEGYLLEPVEGVPAPTVEDLGVLAFLCERLDDEIGNLTARLRELKRLRESAVYRVERDGAVA